MENNEQTVIIYDASCNLCNSLVRFIIRLDKKEKFRFASLHSSFVKNKMPHVVSDELMPDSLIYFEEGNIYLRSDAALMVAKKLGGIMLITNVAYLFPQNWRDIAYNYLAKLHPTNYILQVKLPVASPVFSATPPP